MHIRPATLADLPRITEIGSQAFQNTDLCKLLFPHKQEHWDDWVYFWHWHIREFMLQPNVVVIVAETGPEDIPEGQDPAKPVVAAFAVWQLYTSKPVDPELSKSSLSMVLQRNLAKLVVNLWALIHPCKARSEEGVALYNSAIATVMQECYSGEHAEHWHCWRLATHAAWERKGAATMVTKWGLEKAKLGGITAGLEASDMAVEMYRRVGFEKIGPVEAAIRMENVLRKSFF